MRKRKKNIERYIITPIERESIELLELAQRTRDEAQTLYAEMTASANPEAYRGTVSQKLSSYRRASINSRKAYRQIVGVQDELSARWSDLTKRKRRWLPTAPANAVIDLAEQKGEHFAGGINLYKLLLICFIGSFAGVMIEVLWCLMKNGYIESRAGLVYGPFNLLYGFAAVVLTICLYRFRNKGKWISFVGGMIVGSSVEYICSWGQEFILGSRSWDYSGMPFNINGRICLLYSVFWGFLGVLWIKTIYPWMAKMILSIPNRIGKVCTAMFTVFFVFNIVITALAVFRWSQRVDMIEPANAFFEFIDSRFTNERMENIFANMKFT